MKRWLALVLILTLALGSAPRALANETYTPLQYGSNGDNVATVQEQLKALGYYSGKISGNFLDGTRAAVKAFQADYGLPATGEVNGETEAILMNAEYRALTTGDSGDDVTRLQEALSKLGYYNGKQSGNYLEGTTAAIEAFQLQNGLTATGTADVDTQRLLFSTSALAKDAVAATPAPDGGLGDINDVVMAADGSGGGVNADAEYTSKLKRGAKGEQVKLVQQRLTELGYFSGPISGNYMKQTVEAVKSFQENNGLKADGVTGEDTWSVLFDTAQALPVGATPRPTPVPTPVPYAVTVDVNNQTVIVYGLDESGQYTVPVRRMVCSTGMVGTPSDLGEFVMNGRKARWCYFSLYGSYAQYWTRINENIAFHSVIYHAVDYDALSTKSYNLLGSRASHGCIRLLVADAKWMYENMGEGVKVTVTESLPDDPEMRAALKPPPLSKKSKIPIATPTPTATPAYTSNSVPPQPFRTLKKGSQGEDVFWLQMKLQELGFYTGMVTGTYLGGTQKAVKAFQKANGIYPDGKAGEKTLQAVYASVLGTPTPKPTDTPSPTPQATPSLSPSPTPSSSPAPAPSPSPTAKPTSTPTPKPTPSPTSTSAASPSPSPAQTAAQSPAAATTGTPATPPAANGVQASPPPRHILPPYLIPG